MAYGRENKLSIYQVSVTTYFANENYVHFYLQIEITQNKWQITKFASEIFFCTFCIQSALHHCMKRSNHKSLQMFSLLGINQYMAVEIHSSGFGNHLLSPVFSLTTVSCVQIKLGFTSETSFVHVLLDRLQVYTSLIPVATV